MTDRAFNPFSPDFHPYDDDGETSMFDGPNPFEVPENAHRIVRVAIPRISNPEPLVLVADIRIRGTDVEVTCTIEGSPTTQAECDAVMALIAQHS